MEPIQDLAIVLRSIAYADRHRVVTALSEQNGLISAIARNAIQSRRFGGTLELFAASDWIFSRKPGADLCVLKEAQIRQPFEGLRQDFHKFTVASTLSELMMKFAPQGESCPDLFRLHSNALTALSELNDPSTATAASTATAVAAPPLSPPNSALPLLNAYLAKLLQWSGTQPHLLSCLSCRTSLEELDPKSELSCVVVDAGWICPACRMTKTRHIEGQLPQNLHHAFLRLSPIAIREILYFSQIPIRQVQKSTRLELSQHKTLFQFLESLLVYHVPGFDKKPLKSLRFLDLESSVQLGADSLQ